MKFKELRLKTGLNQTETAKQIGIPRLNYNKYELEQVEPDIKTLCKIANYYNVSLDYLCEHESKHLIDVSMWDESKKAIVNIVEQLSIQNSYIVLGYVSHILKQQNE